MWCEASNLHIFINTATEYHAQKGGERKVFMGVAKGGNWLENVLHFPGVEMTREGARGDSLILITRKLKCLLIR